MNQPGFYAQDPALITSTSQRIEQIAQALEACFSRWEALEQRSTGR
jgi:hypothetical protein